LSRKIFLFYITIPMPFKAPAFLFAFIAFSAVHAQRPDRLKPDFTAPRQVPGMLLAWNDEFNKDGKPDTSNWKYENGFVRNQELQWYQPNNAFCKNGLLVIEGRKERRPNPNYKDSSNNWRQNRATIEYTSSSLKTQGLREFHFGRFEVRARVDTSKGSWPAIWTLGIKGGWPLNGEVDIMEFYRIRDTSVILANTAWGRNESGNGPIWNSTRVPLAVFIQNNPEWPRQFHNWRMDWDKDSISLYIDDQLLNKSRLSQTINPDGSNPFLQPQYLLLNLALGANGGNPENSRFPITYEVDYVRYYKKL
jgi:beta-glucanase (GH16 family)